MLDEIDGECMSDLLEEYKFNEEGAMVPAISECGNEGENVEKIKYMPLKDISLLWMSFPYILIGMSEIFMVATYYELFYTEVPANFKGVAQAIFGLSTTLGTAFGSLINTICDTWGWINNVNADDNTLEYVYIVNIAINVLMFCIFLWLCSSFEYTVQRDADSNENDLDEEKMESSDDNDNIKSVSSEIISEEFSKDSSLE